MPEEIDLEKMVERVPWMAPIHYEILRFFGDHDIWESARNLSKNIGYNRRYTARECQTLADAKLLEKEAQTYRLTEQGRSFLAGDLGPKEINNPTED